MKEPNDISLIPSVFQPLEKLKISGGYGSLRRGIKKKVKKSVEDVEEEHKEPQKKGLIDLTI